MDNHKTHRHSTWEVDAESNSGPDQALDDAVSRFGSMSLDGGMGTAVDGHRCQPEQQHLVAVAGGAGGAAGSNNFAAGLREAALQQQRLLTQQQQQAGPHSDHSPLRSTWETHQQYRQPPKQHHSQPQHDAERVWCAVCGERGTGIELGAVPPATSRQGQDGTWRDERGRRLYSGDEVQRVVEQEVARWRERAASLEANLAKMENEAREALRQAEEALTNVREELKTSQSKTYALSVHLARSNRPSHLA